MMTFVGAAQFQADELPIGANSLFIRRREGAAET